MNEKKISEEWASLSSEQQEAFSAWVKAKLKADKAQEKFINMYLMKEFRELPDKDLQRALLRDYDLEKIEASLERIFIDIVVFLRANCGHCTAIRDPLERFYCVRQCMNGNLAIARVEVEIN
jgi:hypothetical protein